jgi:tRNA dimethylallyltransferase
MNNDKRIYLLGPTATGKTELVKHLNDLFPIDIISVDSAQIYKNLDIGTAKPTQKELIKTPHHLIDIRSPIESYSVGDFKKDVDLIITNSLDAEKIPFLYGGTMMYFNSLENHLDDLPVSTLETKKKVNDELNKFGIEFLFKKLKEIDPVSAKKINPNDSQRIQRALEVYYISGKSLSSFYVNKKIKETPYKILKLALLPDNREHLHLLIQERVEYMLERGLVEEVEEILRIYPSLDDSYPSFRSVGYRQTFHYLKNQISKSELKNKIIFATRQLAKRQMTWMRKMENLEIFDPFSDDLNLKVKDRIQSFLAN